MNGGDQLKCELFGQIASKTWNDLRLEGSDQLPGRSLLMFESDTDCLIASVLTSTNRRLVLSQAYSAGKYGRLLVLPFSIFVKTLCPTIPSKN